MEIKEVDIIKPDNNTYTEREILTAWNEVGRKNNGLTFAWLIEQLRNNKKSIAK